MNGKQFLGASMAVVGIVLLVAAVVNILAIGVTAALSNGLPFLGIGLMLVVAGRYLLTK